MILVSGGGEAVYEFFGEKCDAEPGDENSEMKLMLESDEYRKYSTPKKTEKGEFLGDFGIIITERQSEKPLPEAHKSAEKLESNGIVFASHSQIMGNGFATQTSATVAGSAQSDQASLAETKQTAREIFLASLEKLEDYDSISATVTPSVLIFGRKGYGKGKFLQQWSFGNLWSCWHFTIRIGDIEAELLEASDGATLWQKRSTCDMASGVPIPIHAETDKKTLCDVSRARGALSKAKAKPRLPTAKLLPGLGGLSALLRNVDETFTFVSAQSGELGKEDLAVWRICGVLDENYLKFIARESSDWTHSSLPENIKAELTKPLKDIKWDIIPECIPNQIVLFIGKEASFPYRIEYRRAENISQEGKLLNAIQFSDVMFNKTISIKEKFPTAPTSKEYDRDVTALFIQNVERRSKK